MKQHDTTVPTEPVTEEASPPPTDAQWYSYCAMLARGEAWPGDEGQEGVARRHIRAALDKVNALETENAKLRGAAQSMIDAACVTESRIVCPSAFVVPLRRLWLALVRHVNKEPDGADLEKRCGAAVKQHDMADQTEPVTAEGSPPPTDLVPLESCSNGEAGDYTTTCSGCGEEMDEPHTWRECHAVLKDHVDGLDGAWWGVLGILHDVAPEAHEPEEAARMALAVIERLRNDQPWRGVFRWEP